MEKTYKFEIGETTIKKPEADPLRQRIIQLAYSQGIGIEPIQYERLLDSITSKMIELMSEYDFVFLGNPVDFKKENFVMFKTKVLKSFLAIKKEDETITLQKKNLDILSFYAYNKPWSEIHKKSPDNQNHELELDKIVDTTVNEELADVNATRRNNKRIAIFIAFIILMASSIFLLVKYLDLKDFHDERELKYRSALKSLTEIYKWHVKFDERLYDSLSLPESGFLFRLQFDDDKISYIPYPIKYEIISSKLGSTLKSEPGIKYCEQFNNAKAFGFGKRNCISGCFKPFPAIPYYEQPNSTILRIKLKKKYYLTHISFQWIEVGNNWGSDGKVFVNGKMLGSAPYQSIGNPPASNMLIDEKIMNFKATINDYTDKIDIIVWDITNESEIFINNIKVWGESK